MARKCFEKGLRAHNLVRIVKKKLEYLEAPFPLLPGLPNTSDCQQCGGKNKGVVFATTLIPRFGFNSHSCHVFASLDKTLYNYYLLYGFKQAANLRGKKLIGKVGIRSVGQLLGG